MTPPSQPPGGPDPSIWGSLPPQPPLQPQVETPGEYAGGSRVPQREYEQPRGPIKESATLGQIVRRVGGFLLFALLVGFKWVKILFIGLKGFKFFGTMISMVVSIAAYALLWGLPFAVGFVVLLFVHELGHAIQLRREGIKTTPIMFLPFLGAVIGMKELPRDAYIEAKVGLAGPILGTAGAVATLVAARTLDNPMLNDLAFTAFFLNLFNLVPVSPLDGGRAVAAIDLRLWAVGLLMLGASMFFFPNPVLLIILLFGLFDVWGRWKRRHADADYYAAVTPAQRLGVLFVYLGLAAGLVWLMAETFVPRSI